MCSKGLSLSRTHVILPRTKKLITVSRTPSIADWIEADVSTKAGITKVSNAVGNSPLDALLYMGGMWESEAFTSKYSFENCSDRDLENVITVNLLAPIRLVKSLLPALKQADNPKIIFMGALFMGALSGLDNFPAREVANSASKFGLRGAVHSL